MTLTDACEINFFVKNLLKKIVYYIPNNESCHGCIACPTECYDLFKQASDIFNKNGFYMSWNIVKPPSLFHMVVTVEYTLSPSEKNMTLWGNGGQELFQMMFKYILL